MGPSQICGCPFREPRVFEIAHYVNKEGPDLQCRGSQLQLWDFALQRLVWRSSIPQWAEAAESFKNWERRRWRKFTWSVCLSLSAVLTSGPKSRILCWKSMQLWCRRHAGDEGSSSDAWKIAEALRNKLRFNDLRGLLGPFPSRLGSKCASMRFPRCLQKGVGWFWQKCFDLDWDMM